MINESHWQRMCKLSFIFNRCPARNPLFKSPPISWKPPPYSGNRPGVPKNALPGPKKVTDMTPKKKPCSEIYRPPLFCKKTGPIWYSLASAASFLIYPSVYGVTTLCYISIPRWLEKYSTAMCYSSCTLSETLYPVPLSSGFWDHHIHQNINTEII